MWTTNCSKVLFDFDGSDLEVGLHHIHYFAVLLAGKAEQQCKCSFERACHFFFTPIFVLSCGLTCGLHMCFCSELLRYVCRAVVTIVITWSSIAASRMRGSQALACGLRTT